MKNLETGKIKKGSLVLVMDMESPLIGKIGVVAKTGSVFSSVVIDNLNLLFPTIILKKL